MAWTLVLILVIAGYFLVAIFSKIFRIFQRKSFVYPSEAEIDQTLPPEIIETILTNTDLGTLYTCALVSKYWRHHAEKEHIIKDAIKNDKSMQVNMKDLWTDISRSNRYNHIQLSDIEFLKYDEKHYKPQWNARDRQYVEKNGKTFLDVEFSSVIKLKEVLAASPGAYGDEFLHRYVVRTRLKYYYANNNTHCFINPKTYEFVYIEQNTLPQHIIDNIYPQVQIEIVEELASFKNSTTVRIANPSLVRILDTRNMLGGVPLDGSLFGLMYLLFTPCIVRDLWNGSDDAKYYVNLIAANIGLIGTIIASVMYVQDYVRMMSGAQKQAGKRIVSIGVIGVLIFSIILYKWTIEFGFYCFLEALTLLYGVLLMDLERHPKGNKLLFISFCLVVSIVDWKLAVDSIRSGDFWIPLLYSLMHHIFVIIWAQCMATSGYVLWKRELNWAALTVDATLIKILFLNIISILYITCAAPYTTRKIHL